jgi:hypothetical protein
MRAGILLWATGLGDQFAAHPEGMDVMPGIQSKSGTVATPGFPRVTALLAYYMRLAASG